VSDAPAGVFGPTLTRVRPNLRRGPKLRFPSRISFVKYGTQKINASASAMTIAMVVSDITHHLDEDGSNGRASPRVNRAAGLDIALPVTAGGHIAANGTARGQLR
jgi:hypothetical protein